MHSKQALETKSEPKGLPDFFLVPPEIQLPIKTQIDARSVYFARAMNEEKLKKMYERPGSVPAYDADKAAKVFGQRFVGVAGIIDGVCYLMLLPSYDFDEATELLPKTPVTQEFLNKKIKLATDLFSSPEHKIECKKEHIVMPDHSVFTGIVHRQIIKIFKEEMKEIIDRAKAPVHLFSFSGRQKGDIFEITDRAATNSETIKMSSLAALFNLYAPEKIKDFAKYKPAKFSFYYKCGRSLYRPLIEGISQGVSTAVYPNDDPSVHLRLINFKDSCEASFTAQKTWKDLQKEFQTNRTKACEILSQGIVRNLYIYLFKGVTEWETGLADISAIIAGLKEAKQLGIPIDYSYVPAELENHPLITQTMRSIMIRIGKEFDKTGNFNEYSRPLIFYLVEYGLEAEVNFLLENNEPARQEEYGGHSGSLIRRAVNKGHEAIVLNLLKHGAIVDQDVLSEEWRYLLRAAQEKNMPKVIEALLNHLKHVKSEFATTDDLILHLTELGYLNCVALLIRTNPPHEQLRLIQLVLEKHKNSALNLEFLINDWKKFIPMTDLVSYLTRYNQLTFVEEVIRLSQFYERKEFLPILFREYQESKDKNNDELFSLIDRYKRYLPEYEQAKFHLLKAEKDLSSEAEALRQTPIQRAFFSR
ncbi:MAG: hypothetical protein ACYCQI_12120 [Gammaproteobacteria bacterium]